MLQQVMTSPGVIEFSSFGALSSLPEKLAAHLQPTRLPGAAPVCYNRPGSVPRRSVQHPDCVLRRSE